MGTSTPFVLMTLLAYLATISSARKIFMKVNLGGSSIDGFSGEEELQLGEEAVKTRFHGEIKGTGDDLKVFETQRFARYEDLVINVPVPDGIYSVTLMFAETWKGAFEPGKRVFDVYLGSKPGGIVRVAENFDPFRSGGPAGPVRRKYEGIATYDGLIVALRPIKQNPQIAGIVVNGFSYSEPLLDELPTVTGDLSEVEDFSVLANIGPRPPADPSTIYDPSLNPKFKDRKSALSSAISSSSHHPTTLPASRTSVHAQQSMFSSGLSGPSTRMSPSFAGSNVQKTLLSPGSQSEYGSNPFSGRRASQFPTFPRSPPRLGFRAGTVRMKVQNVNSSHYIPHEDHKLKRIHGKGASLRPPSPPSGHLRHGRRLASIPSDVEEQNVSAGSETSISNISEQSKVTPFLADYSKASSLHLSLAQQQDSSAPKYSEYPVSTQGNEEVANQAVNVGQTTGYSASMDTVPSWTAPQHDLPTGRTNPDPQVQRVGESLHALSQAQTESMRPSSPFAQTRDLPAPADLHSISQSTGQTKPMTNQASTSMYVSNSDKQPQESFSEPGNQGSRGQISHSQSEEKPSQIPFSQSTVRQSPEHFPTQTESVEQRNAVMASTHMGGQQRQANAVVPMSVMSDLAAMRGSDGYDSQKEIAHQRVLNVGESFHGERRAQQQPGNSAFRDSLQTRSQGSLNNAVAPAGMEAGQADDYKSSPPRVRAERQLILSETTSSPESKNNVNVGTAEQNWRSVRTFLDSGGGTPRTSRGVAGDEEGSEAQQPISSRSMRSMSVTKLSDSADPRTFRGLGSGAESPMLSDVPTPGVHNGNGILDGLCLDNRTHCSCGMVEEMAESPEECLFVDDERVNPMECIRKPCSGKLVCACAPGASTLCQRSVVNNILVRVPDTKPEGTDDPNVVLCKRETLEHDVTVLTPII